MTKNRCSRQAGCERVLEMLAILQLGLCGRCGRARYTTRRTARHAARIAAPGIRLRAYRCGDAWHLTSPSGRPQHITPPVTMPPVHAQTSLYFRGRSKRRSLDRGRGECCNGRCVCGLVLEREGVPSCLARPHTGHDVPAARWMAGR
ncbi:hypothetical protein AB0C74_12035 [Spirillospora sp. NPDC048832]